MNKPIDHQDLRLKFVLSEDVLLHEETDPLRTQRLRSAVERDGFLRNPPVAAQTEDGRYAVLDGATRTTMLKEMGMNHILLQIVPYTEQVRLDGWYHVLPDEAAVQAHAFVDQHASLEELVTVEAARASLQKRTSTAALVNTEGMARLLTLHTDTPWARRPEENNATISAAGILRGLVDTYGGAGEIYRIVHEDLVDIVQSDGKCPCVVMFPTFTPAEILGVSTSGDLLPAGITRHLIPGRALNVNLPIDRLSSNDTLDEKKLWLRGWLKEKILGKKVRYYHEPVFIFDD